MCSSDLAKKEAKLEYAPGLENVNEDLAVLSEKEAEFLPIIAKAYLYLSGTPFKALATGEYAESVQEQVDWAHKVGITAIPAFVFDDRYLLMGAQPYEVFQQVMDKVLTERRQSLGEG